MLVGEVSIMNLFRRAHHNRSLSLLKDKNFQLSLHLLTRTHLVRRLRERLLFLAMFMGEQLNHLDKPVASNKRHEQSPLLLLPA